MFDLVLIGNEYSFLNMLSLLSANLLEPKNTKLLISSRCENSRELVEYLDAKKIFNDVEMFKARGHDGRKSYKALIGCYLKKCQKYSDIKKIYISAYGSPAMLIYTKLILARNSKATVSFIDEGYNSYLFDFDNFFTCEGIEKFICSALIGNRSRIRNPGEIWLREPHCAKHKYSCFKKLPKINMMDKDWYNAFFPPTSISDEEDRDIVYFGTTNSNKANVINLERELKILECLDKKAIAKRIMYKQHPRSEIKLTFSNICNTDLIGVSWERVLLNTKSKKRIYISVNSTASVTGNFFFDSNDTIIFLYLFLLRNNTPEYEYMGEYVSKLRDLGYIVYTPKNEDELLDVLQI